MIESKKEKLSISFDIELLKQLDDYLITDRKYRNRSHWFEMATVELLNKEREDDGRKD